MTASRHQGALAGPAPVLSAPWHNGHGATTARRCRAGSARRAQVDGRVALDEPDLGVLEGNEAAVAARLAGVGDRVAAGLVHDEVDRLGVVLERDPVDGAEVVVVVDPVPLTRQIPGG